MPPADSLPPDRAGSPSSIIVTFAGCYLRDLGGWIAVADLITLLEPVGVPAPAVRQAVSRLCARGFLVQQRRGSVAGYALTEAGLADLAPGDERIFRYGQAAQADGWVVAVFTVPESQRQHRHHLRSLLNWLGFGTVGAGVWAAPAALAGPARNLLRSNGLDGYVTWLLAHALDPVDVSKWWDLDLLRAQYAAFQETWSRFVSDDTSDAATCFARTVALVDDWRLLPRIDPGLPAELLPNDWPGPQAWRTFHDLHQRWASPGREHVTAVVAR